MKSIPYSRFLPREGEPFFDIKTRPEDLDRFGPDLVENPVTGGAVPSKADVLAVIFDLQGFTAFCSQRDPHRVVPRFVQDFREWIFSEIRAQLQQHDEGARGDEDAVELTAPPPFFAKFLGDGFLFLWPADFDQLRVELPADLDRAEVDRELEGDLMNVVSVLLDVTRRYGAFLEDARERYLFVPERLRCGAALGTVCAIDNGRDYVGPCINQASRLQKLGPLTFAIDATGLPEAFEAPELQKRFLKQRVAVRGAGEAIAFLLREEWERTTEGERAIISPR